MKEKINKALLLAFPLALAACGGGGGSENPAVDNSNTQNTSPNAIDKYGLNAQERQKAQEVSKELQQYGNGLERTYKWLFFRGNIRPNGLQFRKTGES